MKVFTDVPNHIPAMHFQLETRAEVLALRKLCVKGSSLFMEGSAGEKAVEQLFSSLDKHIIDNGGHRDGDARLTGERK